MNLLSVLAGNYLGGMAQDASSVLMQRAKQAMSSVGFERIFDKIDAQKLTINDIPLSADEKADILDLVNIAKQGEMSSFELEIHGQLFSLDTNSLEIQAII